MGERDTWISVYDSVDLISSFKVFIYFNASPQVTCSIHMESPHVNWFTKV